MYIGPSIFTLAYLFMTAVPYLDPRRAHWANSFRVYPVIKTSLAAFFLLLEALSLRAALHPGHVLKPEGIAIGMGLLFVVLGNYLPKVRSNFFLGIRTPWTLASDRVWEQTHRLAGWTFVVSGASMVLAALVAPGCTLAIVIGAAGLAALVPAGWSWWLYQRTERTSEQNRLE
jgi:uncharacterized membrane protein